MRTLHLIVPAFALLLAAVPSASADELLPPGKPLEQVVDHYVARISKSKTSRPPPGPMTPRSSVG